MSAPSTTFFFSKIMLLDSTVWINSETYISASLKVWVGTEKQVNSIK